METKKEQERVFLYDNFGRKKDVERRLQSVISIANETVIPICKALNMPLLQPNILKWVADDEAFKEAYISKVRREVADTGGAIARLVVEVAESNFSTQLQFYPYPKFPPTRYLSTDEAKLLTFDGERMGFDEAKLTEFCNVYMTDKKQIECYRRAEQLCDVLNEFFAGTKLWPKAGYLTTWSSVVMATPEGFKVNPRQDFTKLIKKQ